MSNIIILRGLPGAGKSTWAQLFLDYAESQGMTAEHCSADHFFEDEEGNYNFNPRYIEDAHVSCYQSYTYALDEEVDLIVVDNTNTQLWEVSPYRMEALNLGLKPVIVDVQAPVSVCQGRNIHGVPRDQVVKMFRRWEDVPKFWGRNFFLKDRNDPSEWVERIVGACN